MGILKNIWDSEKDGSKKEQRSFLRFAIIVTAFFALFLLVKKDNLIRWIEAGVTLARQEKQIESYKRGIDQLDDKIRMMSNDRDTLEKYARETFFFSEPGEDVYIIGD